ncbi:MAG TPA: hypothetical protein VE954_38220 [Oligoflexus sp.]|uniref:hypothetical protein n=1 Tax=Oligoflexus sp. TaxID=1971216 RepID=UPI002D28011A|nr:hypothetical protein [Oligoflexus sp.]HYX38976.1 hypothetical protein [Oligoflexus sp.]
MDDEPVPWKYYVATGVTAVIACFLSAVQGDTGIFFRVREILIMILRTDVHPLWVFVPAFLLGTAACWVERPKNSRSVLIAGLASFSLFGFTPYSDGKSAVEGRNRMAEAWDNLLLHVKGLEPGPVQASLIIRDADFQIVKRLPELQDQLALRLTPPGTYWVEVSGGTFYRNVKYAVTIGDQVVELDVVLEKIGGLEGFLQKFKPAARGDRQP